MFKLDIFLKQAAANTIGRVKRCILCCNRLRLTTTPPNVSLAYCLKCKKTKHNNLLHDDAKCQEKHLATAINAMAAAKKLDVLLPAQIL